MANTSYFKTKPRDTEKTVTSKGIHFLEGQVIKVHFSDEKTNLSKKFVEYDVLARNSTGGSVTYTNCRFVQDFSGLNDYKETILEPNEIAIQGKLSKTNSPDNMNGTMVILGFLDGSIDKPMIIGGFPHRRNNAAVKADGIRMKREFRGVEFNINKDGEYSMTQRSPRKPGGEFSNEQVNTSVKFDKEGNTIINQSNGDTTVNEINLSKTEAKMTTSIGEGKVVQEIDGNSEKITTTMESGLSVEVDGSGDKVTYTTSGGTTVEIDGSGTITLTANSTIIKIDGNSGKIELTGQMVDVGAAASALAALGPQLVSWLSSHTHQYNPGPGAPVPSQPPTVPPPASLLSTTVKIKA